MPPRRVLVAGGASANAEICQVFADVFGAPVLVDQNAGPDSAALGAALRARAAVAVPGTGTSLSGEGGSAGGGGGGGTCETPGCVVVASPREEAAAVYSTLLSPFAEFERALQSTATPNPFP